MAHDNGERFTPESVDEQIEQYQRIQDASAREIPTVHTVQTLQRYYAANGNSQQSLERVWQRFAQQRAEIHAGRYETSERALQLVGREYKQKHRTPSRATHPVTRRLTMIAAVVFVTLLVGSMLAVFQLARHASTTGRGTTKGATQNLDAGEIYAQANGVLYRLNPTTDKPLWHVQADPTPNAYDVQIAGKVVNHIYYYWTQDSDNVYYKALNTSDGSLRWQLKLPSYNLLYFGYEIVQGVFYYAETSLIAGNSKIIALDASTGHQLWQHQYNNTGIDLGLKNSTDGATGFRLEAATNGMLYAATSITKNGQGTLSLYGLSTRDGSVVWQKSISTRDQIAVEQVTGNILYIASDPFSGTPRLNAYDATTGNPLWNVPLDGKAWSLTIYNGHVYADVVGNTSRSVYVLNEKDGSLFDREDFAFAANSDSLAIVQGIIYVVGPLNGKETMTVADTVNHKGRVTYSIPDSVSVQTPPVIHRNPATGEVLIYVSVSPNQVDILRASDGKVLRTFEVGPQVDPPLSAYVLMVAIS